MGLFIGLDLGTTNTKACVCSADDGRVLRTSSSPTPFDGRSGRYDADALFNTAVDVIKTVVEGLPSYDFHAIGVSSMAESGVMVDRDGKALTPVIPWYDSVSVPQAEELRHAFGDRALYSLTGQFCSSKFGITKLMWTKYHMPDAYAQSAHWLSINDYILFRLSGSLSCDYSIAARTMAFDIRRLTWAESILHAAGLPAGYLPECVPGGHAVGTLLPDIAAVLGLPRSVIISTGGHDHACAAVGTGCIEAGTVLDSMGTSEVAIYPIDRASDSDELYRAQVTLYPHCGKTLYRALTSMQACGASLNWFNSAFTQNAMKADADTTVSDPFSYMQQAAQTCNVDSIPYYFPFIRGTLECPDARGCFFGLTDADDYGTLAKSVFDGLSCEFTDLLRRNASACGTSFHQLCAVGGPSASAYLIQRKADMLGIPVRIPAIRDAASLGAARLAAVAAGEMGFEDIRAGTPESASSVYYPHSDPAAMERLDRYAAIRKHIIASFKEVSR